MERPRLDALFKPDQIFESNDAKFLSRLTGDTRFDRKSAKVEANGLAVCLSALGNGPAVEGGVIAVGIENDGRITGCKSLSARRLQEIESSGRDLCHDGRFETRRVEVVNDRGDQGSPQPRHADPWSPNGGRKRGPRLAVGQSYR